MSERTMDLPDPKDFTDDEWLAVMRVVPPDADVSVAQQAVAERRGRGGESVTTERTESDG